MKKLEYFLRALNGEAFRYKAWVIHAFSMTELPETEEIPFRLYRGDKHYYFNSKEGEENFVVELTDTDVNQPAFNFRESIKLKAGDVLNLFEDITTTYGKLLVNTVALVYPLGDKIPYVNTEFDIKKIEAIIEKRLTTDEEYLKKKDYQPENPIYVSEYLKFVDALLSLEGYAQLSVPSASPKTLMTDPRVAEVRAQLLEKYKDKLHDPVTIAAIEAELIKMDREWIKGDISEGFFIKDKIFDVARKRMYLMYGYERPFDGAVEPALITKPLTEGWDVNKLPAMVNSLREGSYNRGSMTALGGYATKIVNRMLQNVTVDEDDCGSTLGLEWDIKNSNKKEFIGFFMIEGKKSTELTDENIESLVGKRVTIRSPMFCKTPKTGYCKTCIGKANSENENALPSLASEITSKLMSISMAKMHGTALKTSTYAPIDVIS